ncbi:MAG: site-specific DNA-methyltransferase [Rickettsiales bacterium]|nr:site-specific DNA-methyltransferase [Rickettsiales bacterium]
MSAKSIHTCVTSPPYWGLRDYGTATWVGGDPNCPHYRTSHQSDKTITGHKKSQKSGGIADSIYKTICPKCGAVRQDRQLGLEETPQEYVDNLVKVFREVKRVLRDDGTLWLNLGDSYSSGGRTSTTNQTVRGDKDYGVTRPAVCKDIKPKDLVGIPWKVAFGLQEDGWYLRQDIIWNKPNPMPESVKDRCTKAHEYIFLLSKQPKYYFDNEAIKVESSPLTEERNKNKFKGAFKGQFKGAPNEERWQEGRPIDKPNFSADGKSNKRSVWTVTTKPYKEAHFATYPPDLIEPCILAGCPKGGTVLDPFGGSGTTALVADRLGRDAIIIELNKEYAKIAEKRLIGDNSLFANVIVEESHQ